MTKAPESKTRLRLWLALLRATNHIEAQIRRRLRDDHETTLPRFDVLAALFRHPEGLKMSELSRYLKVSNGNVTGIVERLTEEGLVQRVSVPGDRRANLASLTQAGHEVFTNLASEHELWINELLGRIGPDDAEELTRLLGNCLLEERLDEPV